MDALNDKFAGQNPWCGPAPAEFPRGAVSEAYDTDAYGNTLIFIEPGSDGRWFTDDDAQSDYGANEIIYCGYRLDPESQLYYVRNRTYNPVLGRWIQRDPIGYEGGINLYGYLKSGPVENVDPSGLGRQGNYLLPPGYLQNGQPVSPPGGATKNYLSGEIAELLDQANQWAAQGDYYASLMMKAFAMQQFPGGNSGLAFEGIAAEIIGDPKYRAGAQKYFQQVANSYGRPGVYFLPGKLPPGNDAFTADFKPAGFPFRYGFNYIFGHPYLSDLGIALGVAHFGYPFAVLAIHGCPGHLKWNVFALMEERNRYHFSHSAFFDFDPPYDAGDQLQHGFGFKPFFEQRFWPDSFSGKVGKPAGAAGSGWGGGSWVTP